MSSLRKVVECGQLKRLKVEVYLMDFKFCIHPNLSDVSPAQLSRATTVGEIDIM